jgi:hypothetical protein
MHVRTLSLEVHQLILQYTTPSIPYYLLRVWSNLVYLDVFQYVGWLIGEKVTISNM